MALVYEQQDNVSINEALSCLRNPDSKNRQAVQSHKACSTFGGGMRQEIVTMAGSGAGDGTRTRDVQLGKLTFCH